MSDDPRLSAQLAFLTEADRLKTVLRASRISDNLRRENSAEHSWHLALYAMVLADQAATGTDITRVIRMLLIHDIIEIDAGDVPIHAAPGTAPPPEQIAATEAAAATRLFGLLPADQAREFRALWDEFEAGETPDAIFARSLDRVQPLVLNLQNGGGSWQEYNVTRAQLETRVGTKVQRGAPKIWDFLRGRIDNWFAVNRN